MTRRAVVVCACLWASSGCGGSKGVCSDDSDCMEGTRCAITPGQATGLCVAKSGQDAGAVDAGPGRPDAGPGAADAGPGAADAGPGSDGGIACDKPCGEDFHCEWKAGAEECRLDPGREANVSVEAPGPDTTVKAVDVPVVCVTTAPQLIRVTASASADGNTTNLPAAIRVSGTDRFATHFDTSQPGVADGVYDIRCAVEYGPVGETVTATSAPTSLRVDKTAPLVEHTAPAAWHRRSGTLSLSARVVDSGSGLAAGSVKASVPGVGEVAGVAGAAETYVFQIDLANITPANVQGTVTYSISAADLAGNLRTQTYALKVDAQGPSVFITAAQQEAWHAYSGGVFTVRATVGAEGAPAARAVLRRDGATDEIVGVDAGTDFRFTIDPVRFGQSGAEAAYGWTLRVTDQAGNEGSATGALRIDGKGPVVTIVPTSAWVARGSAGTVVVTASDAGAGVAPGSVKVAGQTASCAPASHGSFSCSVPTGAASAGVEGPMSFGVGASDLVGNGGSGGGSLNVDDKPPVVTVAPNGTWFDRGANATVSVTVSDGGVGVDPATVRVSGTTQACTAGGGAFTCAVPTAGAEEGVEGPMTLTIDAADRVGHLASGHGAVNVDDKPPQITITGPDWLRAGTGSVTATATDAGAGLGTVAQLAITSPVRTYGGTVSGGAIAIPFDLSDAAPDGGTYQFACVLKVKDKFGHEGAGHCWIGIDRQPPTITEPIVQYPSGRTNALRRDPAGTLRDRVTVYPSVTDPENGSGLLPGSVALLYTLRDGTTRQLAPSMVSDPVHLWHVDVSEAQFGAAEGPLALTVIARDRAGNAQNRQFGAAVTRKLWEYHTGTGAKVLGGLAYSAGRVYFALPLPYSGASNNLYAVDAADGSLAWATKLVGTPTTPVAVGQNQLFIGADGLLFAVTRSGGTGAWDCGDAEDPIGRADGALAVGTLSWSGVPRETVYFASSYGPVYLMAQNPGYYCFRDIRIMGSVGHSTVALGAGRVVVGTATGQLVAGSYATTSAGAHPIAGAALDSAGGAVFTYPGFAAKVTSFAANPLPEAWRRTEASYTQRSWAPPSLQSDSSLYVGSDDGRLFAFDAASAGARWSFGTPDAFGNPRPVRTTAAVGQYKPAGGAPTYQVYFGASNGRLYALSDAGTLLWAWEAGAAVETSPALDCKGVLYAGTNNGRVAAFVTDSQGLAESAWPRYQHDNRNSGFAGTPIYVNGVCQDD